MDTISGIPAHPLFVHIPVILIPLAAVGVIVMVIKPAWKERYQWATLAVSFVGMVGAILSAGAGESLEDKLRAAGESNSWEDHAEAGEMARNISILFFLLLAAYILIPWFLRRRAAQQAAAPAAAGAAVAPAKAGPSWLAPVLSALVVIGAVGAVVAIVDAGHSGAKSVWSEEDGGDGD